MSFQTCKTFIFGKQITIFLMKYESFLTLHRQQCNWNVPRHRNVARTSVKQSMWHQWFYRSFMKLREDFLCAKKTKITTYKKKTFLLFQILSSAIIESFTFTCRGSWVVLLSIMEEYCMWFGGEKLLNKIIIFVFFAHKKYSRSCVKLQLNHWWHIDCFTDILTMFLGLGTFQLCCCLWRVRKLGFHQKYLN